jgi:hypothetical protein
MLPKVLTNVTKNVLCCCTQSHGSYLQMGKLLSKMGDYTRAMGMLEFALLVAESEQGPSSSAVAVVYNEIGTLLRRVNDAEGAIMWLTTALAVASETMAPVDRRLADIQYDVASCLAKNNNHMEASNAFVAAQQYYAISLGSTASESLDARARARAESYAARQWRVQEDAAAAGRLKDAQTSRECNSERCGVHQFGVTSRKPNFIEPPNSVLRDGRGRISKGDGDGNALSPHLLEAVPCTAKMFYTSPQALPTQAIHVPPAASPPSALPSPLLLPLSVTPLLLPPTPTVPLLSPSPTPPLLPPDRKLTGAAIRWARQQSRLRRAIAVTPTTSIRGFNQKHVAPHVLRLCSNATSLQVG